MVCNFLTLGAIQRNGSSRVAAIEITYPVFTMIFMALFFQERLPAAFYAGTGVMLVGAGVVIYALRSA